MTGMSQLLLHLEDGFADGFVGSEAVVLNLEEEVSLAEHLFELAGGSLGLVVFAGHEVLVDLSGEASGEGDEALGVPGEEVFRDAGLAIEAVERGLAGEADEVAVAGLVLGEDEEVLVAAAEVAVVGGL